MKYYVLTALLGSVIADGHEGSRDKPNQDRFGQYSQCLKGPSPPFKRERFSGHNFVDCSNMCSEDSRNNGRDICCDVQ